MLAKIMLRLLFIFHLCEAFATNEGFFFLPHVTLFYILFTIQNLILQKEGSKESIDAILAQLGVLRSAL